MHFVEWNIMLSYSNSTSSPHWSQWCGSCCWIPRTFSLACSYGFWVWRGQNEQRTLDLLKLRLSHQISCKHRSRSISGTFKYLKYCLLYLHHTINSFPSSGLSYWKLKFPTQKNVMNKPKKSLRVREITAQHSTGFSLHAGQHVCTRQCEHPLFIHMWTFGVGPECRTRSVGLHTCTCQCECTFTQLTDVWRSLNEWRKHQHEINLFFPNVMLDQCGGLM